jgi:hypothetical protein
MTSLSVRDIFRKTGYQTFCRQDSGSQDTPFPARFDCPYRYMSPTRLLSPPLSFAFPLLPGEWGAFGT